MLSDLRNFITRNFGFGDFIFRLPDDTEVGKAAEVSAEIYTEENFSDHAPVTIEYDMQNAVGLN